MMALRDDSSNLLFLGCRGEGPSRYRAWGTARTRLWLRSGWRWGAWLWRSYHHWEGNNRRYPPAVIERRL